MEAIMSNSIYHKHHIIPKHMGGTDDESNIVKLTVAGHAAVHLWLYETYGCWQDKIAYNVISGRIETESIIREINREAAIERWKNPVYRNYMSLSTSNFLKKQWEQNQEYKEKQTERSRQHMIKMWQDDKFGEKVKRVASDTLKQTWKDPKFRLQKSEEVSNRLKKYWQDPDYKKKMSKISSDQSKERWKNPKNKEKQANKTKDQWGDPNSRKKKLDGIKKSKRSQESNRKKLRAIELKKQGKGNKEIGEIIRVSSWCVWNYTKNL